eukprot:scpid73551/ scgid24600/ 
MLDWLVNAGGAHVAVQQDAALVCKGRPGHVPFPKVAGFRSRQWLSGQASLYQVKTIGTRTRQSIPGRDNRYQDETVDIRSKRSMSSQCSLCLVKTVDSRSRQWRHDIMLLAHTGISVNALFYGWAARQLQSG